MYTQKYYTSHFTLNTKSNYTFKQSSKVLTYNNTNTLHNTH